MRRSILARTALLTPARLAAALLLSAAARADEARPLLLALEKGEVSYTVVHKLHQVTGATRKLEGLARDRKSTRLNSSHDQISYAVFCLKKKTQHKTYTDCKNKKTTKDHQK